jgi:hypothetical protein
MPVIPGSVCFTEASAGMSVTEAYEGLQELYTFTAHLSLTHALPPSISRRGALVHPHSVVRRARRSAQGAHHGPRNGRGGGGTPVAPRCEAQVAAAVAGTGAASLPKP